MIEYKKLHSVIAGGQSCMVVHHTVHEEENGINQKEVQNIKYFCQSCVSEILLCLDDETRKAKTT